MASNIPLQRMGSREIQAHNVSGELLAEKSNRDGTEMMIFGKKQQLKVIISFLTAANPFSNCAVIFPL